MRNVSLMCVVVLAATAGPALAQVGGNAVFAPNQAREKRMPLDELKRPLGEHELPPDENHEFVDAAILLNVLPDSYVATFAIAREGPRPADANLAMQAVLDKLLPAFRALGIDDKQIFVDFVAQNRIYGFEVQEGLARERLEGFELKKNVVVHYTERALLDRLILAAADAEVYDLVKVDVVLQDEPAARSRLLQEAASVMKQKMAQRRELLDVRYEPGAQVYIERFARLDPIDQYLGYIASESETVANGWNRASMVVQSARKARTFYFAGVNTEGFDRVINPVILEPPVQLLLYVKAAYRLADRPVSAPPADR